MKVNSSGALEVVSGDSTAKGLFASSGKTRITIVDGTARTGLYAPDGSLNVVVVFQDDTYLGVYHPCGATRGTIWDGSRGQFAPNGAVYMEGLWTPQTDAEVHLDFINRGYYWNGSYRSENDFTTFTGANFVTESDAAGLTGVGSAAAQDISIAWSALGISAPFVVVSVFRPSALDSTNRTFLTIEAATTPVDNRIVQQVSNTNVARHQITTGAVAQASQVSSALTVDTNYAIGTLIQTNLIRNSLSGATAGAEDVAATLPTLSTLRLLEGPNGTTPYRGALRHVLLYQNTGGSEISQADLNTLTAALDGI